MRWSEQSRAESHGRAMVVLALVQTIIDESMHIVGDDDLSEISIELAAAVERYQR